MTTDAGDIDDSRSPALGRRIQRARLAAGDTLATLAKKTGISASTLSKIENDKVSPTFSNLVRLADGLKVQLNDLIGRTTESAAPTARIAVTRFSEIRYTKTPSYEMGPLCSDILNKRMNPLLNRVLPAGEGTGDRLVRHLGEEFLFVVEGAIEVQTEHYRPIRLETGDSAYFDSQMAHRFVSVGPEPARILMVWLSPQAQSSEDTMAYATTLYGPHETGPGQSRRRGG